MNSVVYSLTKLRRECFLCITKRVKGGTIAMVRFLYDFVEFSDYINKQAVIIHRHTYRVRSDLLLELYAYGITAKKELFYIQITERYKV